MTQEWTHIFDFNRSMDTPSPKKNRGVTKLSLYRATVSFMNDNILWEGLTVTVFFGAFNIGAMISVFHNVADMGDGVAPLVAFILLNIGIVICACIIFCTLQIVPFILYMILTFQIPKADRIWRLDAEYTNEPRPKRERKPIRLFPGGRRA